MTTEISNRDHVIDSRDVIRNIDDLQSSLEAEILSTFEVIPEGVDLDDSDSVEALTGVDTDEQRTLVDLLRLQDECRNYSRDWRHGETLIRGSYFVGFAQDLAADIGALVKAPMWPYRHIDWEAAAEELKQDYVTVGYAGEEYWVKSI